MIFPGKCHNAIIQMEEAARAQMGNKIHEIREPVVYHHPKKWGNTKEII